ncbi:peptidylprolyl isomerase [Chloroflexota bacterium]
MRKRFFLSILVVLIVLTGTVATGCGTAALTISEITVTEVSDTSATISWSSSKAATTQIEYGGTTALGLNNTPDTTLRTSHSVTLSGLSSKTKYHFKLKAVDASDNEVTSERSWFSTKVDATNRTAVIQTSMGTIQIELYEKRAPITTANFIKLAQDGFYDGLIFHRVIDDFMIQGGDPTGTGTGGSGTTIALEIHPELKHLDGSISMARTNDPNSATSQFFICDGAQTGLDGDYAVFGKVIEGIDVVRAIAAVETGASDKPLSNVVMTSVTIE